MCNERDILRTYKVIEYTMNLQTVFRKVLLLIAAGAMFVSVSEFWFYPVDEGVGHIGILLAYGILGYVFFLILNHYSVHTFWGFFLAASVFGFLVEGVPVPVLFTALPFTIVWTSLAWHALITVTIFWYYFRNILFFGQWWKKIVFTSSIGIVIGAWNTFMWNVVSLEGPEGILFQWQPTELFAKQFLFGFGLFIIGHIIFQFVGKGAFLFSRFEKWGGWSFYRGYVFTRFINKFVPILSCDDPVTSRFSLGTV